MLAANNTTVCKIFIGINYFTIHGMNMYILGINNSYRISSLLKYPQKRNLLIPFLINFVNFMPEHHFVYCTKSSNLKAVFILLQINYSTRYLLCIKLHWNTFPWCTINEEYCITTESSESNKMMPRIDEYSNEIRTCEIDLTKNKRFPWYFLAELVLKPKLERLEYCK